jgi:DNA-binding CsgD family transcriptional regulator
VTTPVNDAGPSGGWEPGAFDTAAPAAVFFLITICVTVDLVADMVRNQLDLHVITEVFGILLSLGGLAMMWRLLSRTRTRAQDLAQALDGTRADLSRWRGEAAQLLDGLGALIDQQFREWDLSPAESEVALLLLKGLSLKEIAGVRRSSEPTVRQQAQAVYRKADLTGRAELAAFFLEDLLQPRSAVAATSPAPANTSFLVERARA